MSQLPASVPHPAARRPLVALLAVALATLAACGGDGDGVQEPPSTTAVLVDTLFTFPTQWSSPQLTIKSGGSVVFMFEGGISHNAIFRLNPGNPPLAGAPADIPPTVNAVVRRTFAATGTFPVNCTIHPGMISEVVVVP
jgi:plastocyanin